MFRFAGSQHHEAFETVLFYVDLLIELTSNDDNNSSPVSDVTSLRISTSHLHNLLLGDWKTIPRNLFLSLSHRFIDDCSWEWQLESFTSKHLQVIINRFVHL